MALTQQQLDLAVIFQKTLWTLAKDKNNQTAMDAAHAKADGLRAVGAANGQTTYNATTDTLGGSILDFLTKNKPPGIPSTPSAPTELVKLVYYPPAPRYVPPRPSPPAPPPAAPPNPGIQPQFTFETQQQLVKYEYVYGAKDIQIRGNEYAPSSIYLSTPMTIEGNVMQVSLTTVEDHPVFDALTGESSSRHTSIEYYVTYVDNPSLEEWYPILPEGQQDIKAELLIFDTARTASLRFPALTSGPSFIYKDGIKFTDWSFTSGGTKIQLLVEHLSGSVYTIDYTPNVEIVNPWLIDIYQHGVTTKSWTDTFPDGTNHNKTLALTKYPYIYYDKVNAVSPFNPNATAYTPIKVSLLDANIAGPNRTLIKQVDPYTGSGSQTIYTYNITDYKTKDVKIPKPYSLSKTTPYTIFEYWQDGNKLYFSETFNKADIIINQELSHGNANVQVVYDYLVSNFRMKIILRRNGAAADSVSPIVDQYSLKFKVMK